MRREGFGEGFREERGEEDGVWDWNSELGFGEKGRERERERERESERGFRVGFMGIGFAFHDFGKKFGLLIIIFYNLINANVENCGSFKSFGYIYIYIYI